jgi:transposase
MGAAIALREDFDAADLRRIAKGSRDASQSRRLLALAAIYDGGRRTDAARIGATDLQVIRNWVLRFNSDGPAGLIDRKAPGNPPKLNKAQRQALAAIVESGPIPAIHGVVRWRLVDLRHWIWQEFDVSMDERSVGRILRDMNFVKMTSRPRHHAQNEWALEDFKKTSPPVWRRSVKPCPQIRP